MMRYLIRHDGTSPASPERGQQQGKNHGGTSILQRVFAGFERGFGRLRSVYGAWLAWALQNRTVVVVGFLSFVAASLLLSPVTGRDFSRGVDAGLIKLHVRGVPGTRIEET